MSERGKIWAIMLLFYALFWGAILHFARADLSNPPSATPIPLATITPSPDALNGSPGVSTAAMRADATPPTRSRRTTVTTAADGTFSVTWTKALNSATPVVNLVPLNPAGTNQMSCNVQTANASTVTGKCWQIAASLLNLGVLGNVNLSLAPASSSVISVYVFAIEPTQ